MPRKSTNTATSDAMLEKMREDAANTRAERDKVSGLATDALLAEGGTYDSYVRGLFQKFAERHPEMGTLRDEMRELVISLAASHALAIATDNLSSTDENGLRARDGGLIVKAASMPFTGSAERGSTMETLQHFDPVAKSVLLALMWKIVGRLLKKAENRTKALQGAENRGNRAFETFSRNAAGMKRIRSLQLEAAE